MSMWPLVGLLTIGLIVAAALVIVDRVFSGPPATTRAFRCPLDQREVFVEFTEVTGHGGRFDVTRCSAFSPPYAVRCDKRCVLLC
ncbi:MAG: hypothetical protein HY216_14430 [Candidatus Rokubacteria bacterium]|nr:hypothetical protein [Candidatus Rokubacteria bacterium]